jgi:hypothetical protein
MALYYTPLTSKLDHLNTQHKTNLILMNIECRCKTLVKIEKPWYDQGFYLLRLLDVN